MATKRLEPVEHLTVEELKERMKGAKDPLQTRRWQMAVTLAAGQERGGDSSGLRLRRAMGAEVRGTL